MKTAEEWAKNLPMMLSEQVRSRELIKQIQLDAMKEGARRAAKICYNSIKSQGPYFKTSILTTAEQWTEKDL